MFKRFIINKTSSQQIHGVSQEPETTARPKNQHRDVEETAKITNSLEKSRFFLNKVYRSVRGIMLGCRVVER